MSSLYAYGMKRIEMAKIRFGKDVIHQIPNISITENEKIQLFYTKKEYRIIVKQLSIDLLKSQYSSYLEDVDYCLRGLERFSSKENTKNMTILSPKDYVRAVLLEKQKQHTGNNDTINNISEFCKSLSYFDMVEATERGYQDEKHILESHLTPPNGICQNDLVIDESRARAA